MITCDFVITGYPHEGCVEFGPPDEFFCGTRPVWEFRYVSAQEADFAHFQDSWVERFCETHGRYALNNEDPQSGIYLVDVRRVDAIAPEHPPHFVPYGMTFYPW